MLRRSGLGSDDVEWYIRYQLDLLELERGAQYRAYLTTSSLTRVEVVVEGVSVPAYGGVLLRCSIIGGYSRPKVGSFVKIEDYMGGGRQLRGVLMCVKPGVLSFHVRGGVVPDIGDRFCLTLVYVDMTRKIAETLEMVRSNTSLLRDVILGLILPSPPKSIPSITEYFNLDLNIYQKDAVRFALSQQEVAIIHGPPGTGKTTVLVEIMQQVLSRDANSRILLASGSNAAVDNLVRRLKTTGVQFKRLGHPSRVAHDLHSSLVDASQSGVGSGMGGLLGRVGLLLNISVTSATLTTCMSKELVAASTPPYDLIVVDESAQSLEYEHWAAIHRGRRLILAGDHLQLPPTVLSQKSRTDLATSLMERLILDDVYPRVLLRIQHRSNRAIADWSSNQFYGSQVQSSEAAGTSLLSHLAGVMVCELSNASLVLVSTDGMPEMRVGPTGSYTNPGESSLVVQLVRKLVAMGLCPRDIGVISPYVGQVMLVSDCLADAYPDVAVSTVDGFQGMEREAVIFSAVRSNVKKRIGFLNDKRRLNVAVTRARRQFTLIASESTVEGNVTFQSLIRHMRQYGLCLDQTDSISDF